jgi:hypothetical protein
VLLVPPLIDALSRADVEPTSSKPGGTFAEIVPLVSLAANTGHASSSAAAAERTPAMHKMAKVNASNHEILDPTATGL